MVLNPQTACLHVTGVDTAPMAFDIHPRMQTRRTLVALARRQAILLVQLDTLIEAMDRVFQLTGTFSSQRDIIQDLRHQLACVEMGSPNSLVLVDQIQHHMVALRGR